MAVEIYFPYCEKDDASGKGYARVYVVDDLARFKEALLDPVRFYVAKAQAAWSKLAGPTARRQVGMVCWEPFDLDGKHVALDVAKNWRGPSANLATLLALTDEAVGLRSGAIGGATMLWATGAIDKDCRLDVDKGSESIVSKLDIFLQSAYANTENSALLVPEYLSQFIHIARGRFTRKFELRMLGESTRFHAVRPLVILVPMCGLERVLDKLTEGALRPETTRHQTETFRNNFFSNWDIDSLVGGEPIAGAAPGRWRASPPWPTRTLTPSSDEHPALETPPQRAVLHGRCLQAHLLHEREEWRPLMLRSRLRLRDLCLSVTSHNVSLCDTYCNDTSLRPIRGTDDECSSVTSIRALRTRARKQAPLGGVPLGPAT